MRGRYVRQTSQEHRRCPRVFLVYSSCVPRVFLVCSSCVPRVFLVCSSCVPRVFLVCSSCVPRVFLVCSSCVPRVLLGCSSGALLVLGAYSPFISGSIRSATAAPSSPNHLTRRSVSLDGGFVLERQVVE